MARTIGRLPASTGSKGADCSECSAVLADVFAIPAVLAVIVGVLCWNARAGLIVGGLLLSAEIAVLAYPHHERAQHCELSDSCRAAAHLPQPALSTRSEGTAPTSSAMATTQFRTGHGAN